MSRRVTQHLIRIQAVWNKNSFQGKQPVRRVQSNPDFTFILALLYSVHRKGIHPDLLQYWTTGTRHIVFPLHVYYKIIYDVMYVYLHKIPNGFSPSTIIHKIRPILALWAQNKCFSSLSDFLAHLAQSAKVSFCNTGVSVVRPSVGQQFV